MNEEQYPQNNDQQSAAPCQVMDADEINLLDYLLVLARHKRMILLSCLAAFVLSGGYALWLPNIYTATATILPPQQQKGGLGAMLGGMGQLAALAGVSVGGSSADLYVGMLGSRTIADRLVERFDLMAVYGAESIGDARRELQERTRFSVGKKDGLLTVSVDDREPERAAAMANAYIEELKDLNVKINLASAGRERIFLERRLEVVRGELARAEERLKAFQEKNKAIRIDDQASAIIEAIAQLKGELASKEVELGVLRSYQTEQNPEVRALKEGIGQIREQIHRLERSPSGNKVAEDIFIATSEVPGLGVQFARLLRDFKVQETLFELLTKQHEIAKIEEAKKTSTIQILDLAVAPEKKSKPKRRNIVLLATFVAVMVSVFVAFVRDYVKGLSEDGLEKWCEIKWHINLRSSEKKIRLR